MIETVALTNVEKLKKASLQRQEAIERQQELTPWWKERLIAREVRDTQAQIDPWHVEHDNVVAQQRQDLRQRVYGWDPDPEGFREALDRVGQLDSPEKLERRLRLAEKSGDPVTAHAVFAIALDRGHTRISDSYAASHPEAGERLARLTRFEQDADDVADRFFPPWRAPRPSTLAKRDIERLAAEADQASAADVAARAAAAGS